MEETPQFPKSPIIRKDNVEEGQVVVTKKSIEMNFFDAMKQTIDGKKVTRLAWETNTTFLFMVGNILHISINGAHHNLIVSTGDITATDWIVLPEQGK